MGMELVLDRVTKQYKNKIAVDRLSAVMKEGVYGLLGANGAGKTTLMRMVCGIAEISSGESFICFTFRKGMKDMMRFEWKKIFERRLNVAAMLLGYLLIGVCVFHFITKESFYDEKTDQYIEGIAAYRLDQERAAEQTDVISEEYMTQLIGGIQSHDMDLEGDDAYAEVIRPLGDLFYFAARNYTDMRADIVDRNALNAVDLMQGARFYEQRMEKITDFLNMDFSYGNYRESEKAYWIQKAENTIVPFRWGAEFRQMIGLFVSYPVGACVIPYVWMLVIVYGMIGVVALMLIRKGFVRRE